MNYVATLIVKGQSADRLNEGLGIALQFLDQHGGTLANRVELAPDEAVDLHFEVDNDAGLARALRSRLLPLEIDSHVRPAGARKGILLVADLDSTIIDIEGIDELADAAGVREQIVPITEAAMQGRLDFAESLKARVKLLAGLSIDQMKRVISERVSYAPGAATLVSTMKKAGATTLLVSGGFTFFANHVAEELGFDEVQANRLEIVNDKISGRLIPPLLSASDKKKALVMKARKLGVPLERTLAIGDGANDIPMLRAAGLGIAYHGKKKTVRAADASIEFCGLEAALFFQGFKRSEFSG